MACQADVLSPPSKTPQLVGVRGYRAGWVFDVSRCQTGLLVKVRPFRRKQLSVLVSVSRNLNMVASLASTDSLAHPSHTATDIISGDDALSVAKKSQRVSDV